MNEAYLVYLANGFLPGVPARNLTKEEAEKYDIQKLLKSKLYKLSTEKKTKKRKVRNG